MKRINTIIASSIFAPLVAAAVRLQYCVPPGSSSLPKYPSGQNVRLETTLEDMHEMKREADREGREYYIDPDLVGLEAITFETVDTPAQVLYYYRDWLRAQHTWDGVWLFVSEDEPSHSLYVKNGCRVYSKLRYRGFRELVLPFEVRQYHSTLYVQASRSGETTSARLSLSTRLIVKSPYLNSFRYRVKGWLYRKGLVEIQIHPNS